MEKYIPPKFESFKDFYEQHVTPIRKKGFERLDGRDKGGSRWPNAFFRYDGKLWKVDEDTRIEKLDEAYRQLTSGQDPFLVTSTLGDKNKCLVIKGQPIRPRHFYVYLAQGN
ncbi:MAG TPA: hypothetical protein VL442_01865 [Mucilaginibacter sp.]|jgi:hypothetical protein|nr:hypothetical protein [Mucilaginibacter sp.]